MRLIYKIIPTEIWENALNNGVFYGSPMDLNDGFIHFSTAAQCEKTATKYFSSQDDLLSVDLKFEPSRNGDMFPHLYAPLKLSDIAWAVPLPFNAQNLAVFPELFS
jgi:uncharacterized protein (DUF952 family)